MTNLNTLASGRWRQLSLPEQMGNIGGEISRAIKQQGKNNDLFGKAIERALEFLDLTIADPRHTAGLKELTRAREILCDAAFGDSLYQTTLSDLDNYFFRFALVARAQ